MAQIFEQESRTFSEYLLIPNLTTERNTPDQIDLSAPICKYRKGEEESKLKINIPMVSAVMQSVSNDSLAIALARCGGMSFVFQSQSIESQCEMIRKVRADILSMDRTDVFCVSAENTCRFVLFQHYIILINKYFDRIVDAYIEIAPELDGDNNSSEFVHFSYDACCFHFYSPFSLY